MKSKFGYFLDITELRSKEELVERKRRAFEESLRVLEESLKISEESHRDVLIINEFVKENV